MAYWVQIDTSDNNKAIGYVCGDASSRTGLDHGTFEHRPQDTVGIAGDPPSDFYVDVAQFDMTPNYRWNGTALELLV